MLFECKIVGQILLDHPLSYALTATVDVPAVYLQQFWKIVRKVPDTEDTIIFKLDNQEIIYIIDMFHNTLQLPVETLENPFVAPVNIEIIKSFMHTEDVIQYPRFTKLIIADLLKKFPSIPPRLEEDYHSFKDDILLEIHATDDYKEYETVDRIEPESHKEHLEVLDDDNDNKEEKKYEKKDDEMGSFENRTKKMQTPIPTTPRSPRINLSSDKNIA
ncbi:hypothetical protein Tco_0149485 [Tanacetum coccineum]